MLNIIDYGIRKSIFQRFTNRRIKMIDLYSIASIGTLAVLTVAVDRFYNIGILCKFVRV